MSAKVCLELCADVDGRRLAGAVLHNQEQFGHNLDHMTGLNRRTVISMMKKKKQKYNIYNIHSYIVYKHLITLVGLKEKIGTCIG